MTDSRMARIFLRRSWLIALAVLAGLLGARAVSDLRPPVYTAEATLLVQAEDAFAATRLASTYAAALPNDGGLLRSISRALRVDTDEVAQALEVTSETETAVMRVQYEAAQRAEALLGANVAVQSMTGRSPAALSVPPRLLEVVREARITSSPSAQAPSTTLAIGALLGLALGLVLAVGLERSERRIDTVEDLRDALAGIPATRLRRGNASSLPPAVLERWRGLADGPRPTVAVVGMPGTKNAELERYISSTDVSATGATGGRSPDRPEAKVASGHVAAPAPSGGDASNLKVVVGGPLGADGTSEVLAQRSDMTVLVARRGARQRDVEASVALLGQYGVTPSWALLAA